MKFFFCGSTFRLFYSVGLVYWGLTPQQQPGSYQGGTSADALKYKTLYRWKWENSPCLAIINVVMLAGWVYHDFHNSGP